MIILEYIGFTNTVIKALNKAIAPEKLNDINPNLIGDKFWAKPISQKQQTKVIQIESELSTWTV